MSRRMLQAALATLLGIAISGASVAAQEPVRIGWTAWGDAEFVTKVARRVLEERMDKEVELVQMGIAQQYQGVAQGDVDIMLMSWLPETHRDYMEKFGDSMANYGMIYDPGLSGLAVPTYIPEDKLESIADLKDPEVRKKLESKITCIEPGSGLSRQSGNTVDAYGLDNYEVVNSSGAAMTAALSRAVDKDEWIVVCAWNPHWMFGKWDLRYLDDPKGTIFTVNRVHKIAREGFYPDHMDAAQMFGRMWLPVSTVEKYMYQARQSSYKKAIDQFMEDNEDRTQYWITGEM